MTDRDLHYLLLVGHQRANRRIVEQVYARGLQPGQPKILEFLREHQGCTQKEIGRGCVLDKSSVTGLLRRMEEAELVRREVCPQDRRAARIYLATFSRERTISLRIFLLQLAFNFFWSILFFNFQAFGFALIWLVVLWALILWMIFSFRKVDPLAAWLQVPYLLWVSFAAYLNFGVWRLN